MDQVNILLVDDRPENLTALEAVLDDPGYYLVKARSGKEALRYLLDLDFALILLDAQMPGMDGFETAQLIREREKNRDTPIFFVTAQLKDEMHISGGYKVKAMDYIVKPFDPEILRAKVAAVVELHRRTEQLQQQVELERSLRQALELHIHSLDQLSNHPEVTVTAQIFGHVLLSESAPELFDELVDDYGNLLDLALEEQAFRVDHNIPGELRKVSEQLGLLNAGPRDVVALHKAALKNKAAQVTVQKVKAYVEEGRLMVLELMGFLVSFYRNRSSGA